MRITKYIWLSLVSIALAAALWPVSGDANYEVDRVIIFMLPLTAPTSFVVVVLWGSASLLLHRTTGVLMPYTGAWNIASAVLIWSAMAVVGYVQWFVAVRWLVRRVRRGRNLVREQADADDHA